MQQIKGTNEAFHVEQKKVQNCQSWQPCFGKCEKQFFAICKNTWSSDFDYFLLIFPLECALTESKKTSTEMKYSGGQTAFQKFWQLC